MRNICFLCIYIYIYTSIVELIYYKIKKKLKKNRKWIQLCSFLLPWRNFYKLSKSTKWLRFAFMSPPSGWSFFALKKKFIFSLFFTRVKVSAKRRVKKRTNLSIRSIICPQISVEIISICPQPKRFEPFPLCKIRSKAKRCFEAQKLTVIYYETPRTCFYFTVQKFPHFFCVCFIPLM